MNPADRDRLLKFLRLLASDQDGERSTAASMANKLAERLGGWDKLLASPVQASNSSKQPSGRPWPGQSGVYDPSETYDPFGTRTRYTKDEMMDLFRKAKVREEILKEQMRRATASSRSTTPDEVFNENFRRANANGHSFHNLHSNNGMWDKEDIEKMKLEMERKMREAGVWKDFT